MSLETAQLDTLLDLQDAFQEETENGNLEAANYIKERADYLGYEVDIAKPLA